jgi:HSP20 family protein
MEDRTMNIRNLIPWSQGRREPWSENRQQVAVRREGDDDPVRSLQQSIDRIFDNFWRSFELPMLGTGNGGAGSGLVPQVDVRETDQEVEVVAELPGMDEADVDVSVSQGMLTIRGEKKSEREEEDDGYVLRERSFGRVERIVPLPDGLDVDSAQATFRNGVLTVRIPKTAETQRAAKRISVQRE